MLVLMHILAEFQPRSATDNPFAPSGGPAHPIIEYIVRPNWRTRLEVLFVAAVVAPIVEEIMFRGVFYRHLRDTTAPLGTPLSFLFSALVVNFIFAAIHPQGIVAVPALMALAFGLTSPREWRGTLVPSMVAHGLNNGLLLLMVMLCAG
jgi:membrane protease YdiL (CAAX protease family)